MNDWKITLEASLGTVLVTAGCVVATYVIHMGSNISPVGSLFVIGLVAALLLFVAFLELRNIWAPKDHYFMSDLREQIWASVGVLAVVLGGLALIVPVQGSDMAALVKVAVQAVIAYAMGMTAFIEAKNIWLDDGEDDPEAGVATQVLGGR